MTCKLGNGPEGDVATVVVEVGKAVFLPHRGVLVADDDGDGVWDGVWD